MDQNRRQADSEDLKTMRGIISGGWRFGGSRTVASDFKWRHFEGAVILWAVRWYCKYGISYQNLEEPALE